MLNNIIISCCIRRSKNSFHFAEHFFTYTEISSIYCYYYTPFNLFLLDPSVWVSCKPGNKVFNVLQFFHNFQPVIWRPRPGDGMKSKLMHWNVNETATWLSWKSYQSIVEKNHNYKTWSLKLMGFGIDWGTLTRTKKPQWVCFLYCSVFSTQRWVVLQAYTFVWGYSYYTCTLNYLPYFLLQIITKCQSERVKLFLVVTM